LEMVDLYVFWLTDLVGVLIPDLPHESAHRTQVSIRHPTTSTCIKKHGIFDVLVLGLSPFLLDLGSLLLLRPTPLALTQVEEKARDLPNSCADERKGCAEANTRAFGRLFKVWVAKVPRQARLSVPDAPYRANLRRSTNYERGNIKLHHRRSVHAEPISGRPSGHQYAKTDD
jgi:hypothetical protein